MVLRKTDANVFCKFFASESNPRRKYASLIHLRTGEVSCPCRGWIFHRTCWHVDELKSAWSRGLKALLAA